MKIKECELSVRTINILSGMNIETVAEAEKITWEFWYSHKFAGKKGWKELQYFLEKQGYTGKIHPYKSSVEKTEPKYCFRPKTLRELLDTLSPEEKIVVIHIYGLFGETPKKQKEISEIIGKSKERVGVHKNKALRKLRHPTRAVFFAFLPDDLMEQVFGTTDIDDIIKGLGKTESFTQMKSDILYSIDEKSSKYDKFADKTDKYLKKLNDSYSDFMLVLQGSRFKDHLNDINKMSMRLESQCVNMQSTLQIAQKFIGTEIQLPQTQIQKFFDELSICMLNLNQLEDRFRESIDYKSLIYRKSE